MRCGYILILFLNRSSKTSNFSDFPSKVGSDAVRAFGIGSVVVLLLSGANKVRAAVGRSFDGGWL